MKINFINKHKAKKYLINIVNSCHTALKTLKVPCNDVELNITFCSPAEIKKTNKIYRHNNKVTDVISFPNLLNMGENVVPINLKITKKNYLLDIIPETGNIFLGEILICVNKAKKQAKLFGNTNSREICFLCVHGILHLMGFDHLTESDQKVMRGWEEKILKQLEITRQI